MKTAFLNNYFRGKEMKFTCSIFFLLFICISCTNYRYINAAFPPNNPYFTKKGDSKITAYYSTNADARPAKQYAYGVDLQAAYAVGNHWALTASYFNRKEKDVYSSSYNIYDSSIVHYTRNLFDVGAGYFFSFNAEKTLTANFYAGLANGKFLFHDDGLDRNQAGYKRYYESTITKWYLQPSVNFMPLDYFHMAFATKVSFVHYGKIKSSYTTDELEYFSLNKVANKTLTFVEPSFDFQVGLPSLPGINLDILFSAINNAHREGSHISVRGSNFSIGLNIDLSKIKKRK
ncbi:MAG: hypothetical protein ABIO76_02295 [Ginsengibacter sp.]